MFCSHLFKYIFIFRISKSDWMYQWPLYSHWDSFHQNKMLSKWLTTEPLVFKLPVWTMFYNENLKIFMRENSVLDMMQLHFTA